MYYVYILKNIKDNTHYIGFTNNLININESWCGGAEGGGRTHMNCFTRF